MLKVTIHSGGRHIYSFLRKRKEEIQEGKKKKNGIKIWNNQHGEKEKWKKDIRNI
jgi:hypothetical protein